MNDREEPRTQTVEASEARAEWSRLLIEVFRRQKRVLVEKDGVPVAALVSVEDLAELNRREQEREKHFEALWRTREAFKGVPDEELEREVEKAVAAARVKLRTAAGQAPASE